MSQSLNHLATSLFLPPEISVTLLKLSFAVSKSFNLTQACPRLYQAFSFPSSSSITIYQTGSKISLNINKLTSPQPIPWFSLAWSQLAAEDRHTDCYKLKIFHDVTKYKEITQWWLVVPDMLVWIHFSSNSLSICFLWSGSTDALWRNAGVPWRSVSMPWQNNVIHGEDGPDEISESSFHHASSPRIMFNY